MTDRELLELAAKAAGIKVPTEKDYPYAYINETGIHRDISWVGDGSRMECWNPLTDDGDALRLAVKLRLDVNQGGAVVVVERDGLREVGVAEALGDDSYAATRRAIVRAAAEIGKGMK